jgi:hypothetical protein
VRFLHAVEVTKVPLTVLGLGPLDGCLSGHDEWEGIVLLVTAVREAEQVDAVLMILAWGIAVVELERACGP